MSETEPNAAEPASLDDVDKATIEQWAGPRPYNFIDEFVEKTGLSRSTVNRGLRSGVIPWIPIADRRAIPTWFTRRVASHGLPSPPKIASDQRASAAAPTRRRETEKC